MKQNIRLIYHITIVLLLLVVVSCNNDDKATIGNIQPEGRVYFNVEYLEVDGSNAEAFSVELRYEGTKADVDVEIPYTITYPNENAAVEGEDFILPKSKTFTLKRGKAISQVVLLQRVINNEAANQGRSLTFELEPTEGITIGSDSNTGGTITLTIVSAVSEMIDPNDPNDFIGDKKFTITEGTSTFKIPYFSNRPDIKDTNNDAITRAVVVLQGVNRNAGSYYSSMLEAAQMETANLDSLLIVSPQFLEEEDIVDFALDDEHLYWSSGWRLGFTSRDESTNPRPEQISSFTIMDSLMETLSGYPNLETIIFSGHSAGGQFVNRYSASSPVADVLSGKGINIRFIVNNPSSYVYMDNKRKVLGTENTFAVPEASFTSACPEYNEYRYGLEALPSYLRDIGGTDVIRGRLPQRNIIYMIGQNDNDPNGNFFDTSCEGMLQGTDRFDRALIYFDYLVDYYGVSIKDNQKLHIVPGVGHNSTGMFQSEASRKYVFRK